MEITGPDSVEVGMLIVRLEQMNAFEANARLEFVTRLCGVLTDSCPERCSEVAAETLHGFVERSLSHAEAFGLEFERNIAAYVMLNFVTVPDLHDKAPPDWSTSAFQDLRVPPADRVHALLHSALAPLKR